MLFSNFFSGICQYNTSTVNFCEKNNHNSYILEFYNTVSSFAFVIAGFYGLMNLSSQVKQPTWQARQSILHKNNSQNIYAILKKIIKCLLSSNEQIIKSDENDNENDQQAQFISSILYCVLILIGIFSIYFHAMLSTFSHMLDIMSISLIIATGIYCLSKTQDNISPHIETILGLKYGFKLLLYTAIAFIAPFLLIILQFADGFILSEILGKKINNLVEKDLIDHDLKKSIVRKYKICKLFFVTSMILWMIDYFLCDYLDGYHLHFIFHILIAYVGYILIDLYQYF